MLLPVSVAPDDQSAVASTAVAAGRQAGRRRVADVLDDRWRWLLLQDDERRLGRGVAGHQQMALRFLFFVDDPLGRLEDLIVDGRHDGQWDVEGAERGVDLVAELLAHLALLVSFLAVVVAEDEQRRQRDAGGRDPDEGDAEAHPAGRPFDAVVQRPSDGPVAIDADHAQVEDGRRARKDVERNPSVADAGTERPRAQHFVHKGHGHD